MSELLDLTYFMYCLGVMGQVIFKAMHNCLIYAITSYAEFRNSGIPDEGNLP